jgi:hypothetical protein
MSNEKTQTQTTATPKIENPFMAFDPMQMWAASQQAFQKMFSDALEIESQMAQRAHDAIDQWAKLAHDTLNYSTQLSAQARKLGVEAARKMTPGA